MYRSIDAKFWTDPKIRGLSPAHKLLFLYCITNSHSHVSGIYYMPKVLMQHETGLSSTEVERGIDTLSRDYLCLYDSTTEVLWVRHMLRYQHHGEKIRLAVASQLESLHKCPLIKAFLTEYADIKIPYRYHIDTRAPDIGTGTGTELGIGKDLLSANADSVQPSQVEDVIKEGSADETVAQEALVSMPEAPPSPVWPDPDAFYALYDTIAPPGHPRWQIFDGNRRRRVQQYLKLYPESCFWKQVFEEMARSPFLCGQVTSGDRPPKKRGLDWLLSKGQDGRENCVKTYEGEYRHTFVSHIPPSNGVRHKNDVMQEQQVERYFSVVERTKAYEARERGEVLRETPRNERLLQGPDDRGTSTPLLEGYADQVFH